MLVTFEGIPGAGRKTHIEALVPQLRGNGFHPVVTTGEPGWNNEVSGILKYIALEGNTCAIEKLFLFLADRTGHYERFIRPLLSHGYGNPNSGSTIILCDGGPDSTVAYQGFGARLASIDFLVEANRLALGGFLIRGTYVLDVSPEIAIERATEEKKSRYISYDLEMINRIRKGYSQIAQAEPERMVIVNNSVSFKEANDTILKDILSRKSQDVRRQIFV